MPEAKNSRNTAPTGKYVDIPRQPGRLVGVDLTEYDPDLEIILQQAVIENIKLPSITDTSELPPIILLAGACRTDTGALATVLSLSPQVNVSHIQPFKTVRREEYSLKKTGAGIEYENKTLELLSGNKIEVIKETVGVASQAEFFNPLEPLIQIGYPPDKILVIGTFREPLEVLDSCVSMWDEDYITPLSVNRMFLTINEMMKTAKENDIRAFPYVHEMPIDMGEYEYIRKLTLLAGIDYEPSLVDWGEEKGYENTKRYEIPPRRFVKGSISRKEGGRGGFKVEPHKFVLPAAKLDAMSLELQHANAIYIEMAARAQDIFAQI